MKKIKAIITDVDGVIVGKKQGVNFPLPNGLVIRKLQEIHQKGIPIILCTAKFNYAVRKIVASANLRNPHITDGGALIIDPLDNKIIKKHILEKQLAYNIVSACLANNIYTEVYEEENYYIQKKQISELTNKRLKVLQKEHIAVDSLLEQQANLAVIKIIAFAENENDKKRIEQVLHRFVPDIHFLWTMHPSHLPFQAGIITVKGVSKKQASLEVLDYLKVSTEETLGIGDTLGDWNFMSLCGYVAIVGDESEKLKELAKTKGEGKYFFGSSVDNHGMLEITDHLMQIP